MEQLRLEMSLERCRPNSWTCSNVLFGLVSFGNSLDLFVSESLPLLNVPSPEVNFTVCVPPPHNHFNDYRRLVEMIEVNRMFGAQRLVFYNYSTGPDVATVLRRYESEGLVSVIPWRIPLLVDTWPPGEPPVKPEIHYFGQVAALNDCLYRNMFTSRYIVFTDLDELLVPRR